MVSPASTRPSLSTSTGAPASLSMVSARRTEVAVDVESGVRAGVEGTPMFFINGEMHRGPWDHEHLFQALLEHLPDDQGTFAP